MTGSWGGGHLDDADGDGLTHVADGEATQGRVGGEGLHAHRLGGLHLDVGSVTVLDELGGLLQLLAGTTVNLGGDLRELAGNVGSVAIQHRGIAVADLARVVHDDDLRPVQGPASAVAQSGQCPSRVLSNTEQTIRQSRCQSNQFSQQRQSISQKKAVHCGELLPT